MASESRLLWIIFAVLVALIVVPLALWQLGEARRPILEEVRIVTATNDDPVFRSGLRRVPPDTELQIAAAVRFRRAGERVNLEFDMLGKYVQRLLSLG